VRITFVPFLPDGRCAAIDGDVPSLPSGDVPDGDDGLADAVLRIPLDQAGFRYQRFHEFGRDGDHVLAWIEGDVYDGRRRPHHKVQLAVLAAEDLAARLPGPVAAVVLAAAESYRNQSDESFYGEGVGTLERAYLRAMTVEGGSGYGGSPAEWRAAREPVVGAIERDGTFLDVGCANGLLMESAQVWCAERGVVVEPYGVDLSPALVERARQRLPHWADRIWLGNAADWVHPETRRFDTVHVLLESVPARRRYDLLRHHLDHTVAAGGRLVVSYYGRDAAAAVAGYGYPVAGGGGHTVWIDTVWIDRP